MVHSQNTPTGSARHLDPASVSAHRPWKCHACAKDREGCFPITVFARVQQHLRRYLVTSTHAEMCGRALLGSEPCGTSAY